MNRVRQPIGLILTFIMLGVLAVSCEQKDKGVSWGAPPEGLEPPVATEIAKELEIHGDVRQDEYYWMNDREDPEVISYLEAENAYTESMTAHTESLRETLFDEIKGRIKQDDSSVPVLENGYFSYRRYEDGKDYPIYCRKQGSLEADEEIVLDVNEFVVAQDDYLGVSGVQVTSDGKLLAYAIDRVGRRIYDIHFRNLETGEEFSDVIEDASSNVSWAEDGKTLFYGRKDLQTLRSFQIYRHTLGTPAADDVLVYQEDDDTFGSYVFKTKSKRYMMIVSQQTLSSEYRFVDATNPTGEFSVFLPRERNHEYGIDHYGDSFYIRTNHGAKNFRLMKTSTDATALKNWTEVLPHRDDVLLEDFEIFSDFLVVAERQEGLVQLRIRPWDGSDEHYLDFGQEAYLAYTTGNRSFETSTLRYGYTSMTVPNSVYDYDMVSREKTLLKQDEVLGGYDSDDYVTQRRWATAQDGVKVPVSIVFHKDTKLDGSSALLLYGYGSYGNTIDATFSASRLSLLERGFIYAIAHVRGGEELGRQWYENGKLFHKKNTFTDFIDVAEYLKTEKYADPAHIYAYGGSAGGLLMGAVVNMRGDLFDGVIAAVPFVDVVTTMLDDSIPLTTSEYDEWGNPNDKAYYDYILSYSPYDNVAESAYPHMLVTTGLHDSQVQYWEPAKWVARLRKLKSDDNRLMMKTNMEAGHGGASARDERYKEIAFRWAFLLDLARS
ncbi:MAG: S9 family peptidase [Acidobacteriota bacterium]|nr:S9 family peptidase [Acidobacteriota bacterium]MDH3786403.1 S9 family peptidase [Acidobacteriota bacterium]